MEKLKWGLPSKTLIWRGIQATGHDLMDMMVKQVEHYKGRLKF